MSMTFRHRWGSTTTDKCAAVTIHRVVVHDEFCIFKLLSNKMPVAVIVLSVVIQSMCAM